MGDDMPEASEKNFQSTVVSLASLTAGELSENTIVVNY